MRPPTPWVYREQQPVQLAAHVDRIWFFEGPTACVHKRIFPNGKVELLVNMAEPYRVAEGMDGDQLPDACLTGLLAGPLVIAQPAWQRVLGVRLRPAGVLALFGTPVGELSGRAVDLEALHGGAARALMERCRHAPTADECLAQARSWLEERLGLPWRPPAPEVLWAARRIERCGGAIATEALRRDAGFSKARWASTFQTQIGLTPKLYARVVRLSRWLATVQQGDPLSRAVAQGYYDQPHMTGEVRRLTGLTPGQLLSRRHPVGDGSTAAEPRA
jgi:methylphosphotriester-DNA--protein-cysteine methyltransferase